MNDRILITIDDDRSDNNGKVVISCVRSRRNRKRIINAAVRHGREYGSVMCRVELPEGVQRLQLQSYPAFGRQFASVVDEWLSYERKNG